MSHPPLSASTLQQILLRHPPAPRYWIAYSGGMDSHVLLHLCASLRGDSEIDFPSSPLCKREVRGDFQAVHVHHGLQASADAWVAHCSKVCSDLNVPLLTVRVDARAKPGESPEAVARHARYRALRENLAENDIVLTAQHRDDQAETLLLQLLRGAGLAGLAAMPEFSALTPGFLLRPLLSFSRQELKAYALANSLNWIEDPSNEDTAIDRNFLRREIVPRLEQRWPGLGKALSRSAGHCAEAQQQLNDLSKDLYRSALNADGLSLGLTALQNLHPADRRLVLREWMRMSGFRMPSQAVIERILNEVLSARPDKMPIVCWSEGEVRRYKDGLYLRPCQPPFDTSTVLSWDGKGKLKLPCGNGELSSESTTAVGIAEEAWQKGKISIRYRQGGERCRLPGRSGTHELKKLFQEAAVPPWLRERIPLVYINGELAVIAGMWVCEPFVARPGERNVNLIWRSGSGF